MTEKTTSLEKTGESYHKKSQNDGKVFGQESVFKEDKVIINMAYYCRYCRRWHYPGTYIGDTHRSYSSQRPLPRRVVKRKRRTIWDYYLGR